MTNRENTSSNSKKEKFFQNDVSKSLFTKGIKYLAIAFPLFFISPILITIGFKAINKSNNYLFLIVGCILTIFTVVIVILGFRIILKALFAK